MLNVKYDLIEIWYTRIEKHIYRVMI